MPEDARHLSADLLPVRQTLVRKARLADVNAMYQIINHYAERQRMLPKTQLQLFENLRDYSVVVDPSVSNSLLGCGALHIYWEDLAEIRALAVAPDMSRKGIGTALVDHLLNEALELEIEQVFIFTYEPGFFGRFGFIEVDHSTMPLKVYNECFHCPKFSKCDELAMVLHL